MLPCAPCLRLEFGRPLTLPDLARKEVLSTPDGNLRRRIGEIGCLAANKRNDSVGHRQQNIAVVRLKMAPRLLPWTWQTSRSHVGLPTVHEVLKPAEFRCELCELPADERAIEVVDALRLGYASPSTSTRGA